MRWFAGLVLVTLTACFPLVPIGGRPKTAPFLSKAEIQSLNAPGATRESICNKMGTPVYALPDQSAMAYLKRSTEKKWILWFMIWLPPIFVFPIPPDKPDVEYFQVIGFWFDAKGALLKHETWNSRGSLLGADEPMLQRIAKWIEDRRPPR